MLFCFVVCFGIVWRHIQVANVNPLDVGHILIALVGITIPDSLFKNAKDANGN